MEMNFFERAKKIRNERYSKSMDEYDRQNPEPQKEARQKQSEKLMNAYKQFLSSASEQMNQPMQKMSPVNAQVIDLAGQFNKGFGRRMG